MKRKLFLILELGLSLVFWKIHHQSRRQITLRNLQSNIPLKIQEKHIRKIDFLVLLNLQKIVSFLLIKIHLQERFQFRTLTNSPLNKFIGCRLEIQCKNAMGCILLSLDRSRLKPKNKSITFYLRVILLVNLLLLNCQ